MKRLLTIFFLALACFSANATSIITATITVTNTAGTTNGQTLTVNSDTRTWTNSVFVQGSQILTNNTIGGAATNLFTEVSIYPFSSLSLAHSGTNGITLQTFPGGNLSASLSAGWGTIVLTTNSLTDATVVRVPYTVETAQQQTNITSGIVAMVAANQVTNAIPESAPAVQNLVGITNTQTIIGNKAMTGSSNYYVGGYFSGPVDTNAVNYGNAFSSPGTNSGSEQFGASSWTSAANAATLGNSSTAEGTASTALGAFAHARGNQSSAFGTGAIVTTGSDNGTALGANSTVQNLNATALGRGATASHVNSTAVGYNASTTASNQVMLASAGVSVVVNNGLQVLGGATFANGVTNQLFTGTNNFPAGSDIAFGRCSLGTLANGINQDIIVGTNVWIDVSGPTGAFSIEGIAGGRDGKVVEISNLTGQNMTIACEGGATGNDPTPANRIITMTGADQATTGNGFVRLKYNANTSRWIVTDFNP